MKVREFSYIREARQQIGLFLYFLYLRGFHD